MKNIKAVVILLMIAVVFAGICPFIRADAASAAPDVGEVFITDENGDELYSFKGAGEIRTTVKITNLTEHTSPIYSILALYGGGGDLLQTNVAAAQLVNGEATLANKLLTNGIENKLEDARAEIFVWRNVESMIPIAKVKCQPKGMKWADFYTIEYTPEALLNAASVTKAAFAAYDLENQSALDISAAYYVPTDNRVTLEISADEIPVGLCEIRPTQKLLLKNGSAATEIQRAYINREHTCELYALSMKTITLYGDGGEIISPAGKNNITASIGLINTGESPDTISVTVYCNGIPIAVRNNIYVDADEAKTISIDLPQAEYGAADVITAQIAYK